MSLLIRVVPHSELARDDLTRLRALFDGEYAQKFGEWEPEQPYGYAPHDMHMMACDDEVIVGHVGWARREITVGERAVVIAGVGGVLVSDRARGARLGARLMSEAVASMQDAGGIEFGYLGCREQVVPFYRSCGWVPLRAAERSIDRTGRSSIDPPGATVARVRAGVVVRVARWRDRSAWACMVNAPRPAAPRRSRDRIVGARSRRVS